MLERTGLSLVSRSRDHRKLLCRHSDPLRPLPMTMTSTPSDPHSKKRKHRSTEESGATHSSSKKKKEKRRKDTAESAAPPSQDGLSPQKRKLKSPKDKGKSRVSDPPSEFRMVNASLVLSIPPVFASDLRTGVEEMLDNMVMR